MTEEKMNGIVSGFLFWHQSSIQWVIIETEWM